MKASLDDKIWIALETPQLTTTPISYYYTEKLGISEVLILQLDTNLHVERKKLLGGTHKQYDPRLYPLSDSSMMIGLGYYYSPKTDERYFMDKLTDSSRQAYVMLKVRAKTDTFQYNDTITTYQIYPNPVTEKSIQIRVPRFENLQAYMYNALGQLVGKLKLEEGINTWILDEGLASGLYIIQLYSEEGRKVYHKKLVMQ